MRSKTRDLTFCAIMIALAAALSFIKIFELPQGGSVTLASMVPIILISYKCNVKMSLCSAVIYGVIQLLQGVVYVPADVFGAICCIFLDYIIAFGVLGLSGLFARPFKNPYVKIIAGSSVAIGIRFICHFLSGILIWASYADGTGLSPAVYSAVYNGSFLAIELGISIGIIVLLSKFIFKEVLSKKNN